LTSIARALHVDASARSPSRIYLARRWTKAIKIVESGKPAVVDVITQPR